MGRIDNTRKQYYKNPNPFHKISTFLTSFSLNEVAIENYLYALNRF